MLSFSPDAVSLSCDELCDLPCLVAQQAQVPLFVNSYMLLTVISCFRSFLSESLHVTSGLRKLLLSIISPLSHL